MWYVVRVELELNSVELKQESSRSQRRDKQKYQIRTCTRFAMRKTGQPSNRWHLWEYWKVSIRPQISCCYSKDKGSLNPMRILCLLLVLSRVIFVIYCLISFHQTSMFTTEFMRGPRRCDTSHLSDFNETWSKWGKHQENLADKVGSLWVFLKVFSPLPQVLGSKSSKLNQN